MQRPHSAQLAHRLSEQVDDLAHSVGFSGVVSLHTANQAVFEQRYGYADISNGIPNQVNTRFGMASGTKTLTAAAILRLIDRGLFTLQTPAADLLTASFPGLDPRITVRHLLTHTSGLADYFDESVVTGEEDYFLDVPWYRLRAPNDYLPLFVNRPPVAEPGETFAYNNGGYILLGAILEGATGLTYHTVMQDEVFRPSGMSEAGFFPMNALPERTAFGYVLRGDHWQTNVFNLPIVGASDGGAFCTVQDMQCFWTAVLRGTLLTPASRASLLREEARDINGQPGLHYGLGAYISAPDDQPRSYFAHGEDAGVFFHSQYWPERDASLTLASNTGKGAAKVMRLARTLLLAH